MALVALVSWTTVDLLFIGEVRSRISFFEFLAFGIAVLLVARWFRRPWLRSIGLTVLLAVYVTAHAFFLGVQVSAALVFLVLLIGYMELRILTERFAGLYERALSTADRARIRDALARAALRLAIAAVLAVVVPIIAADLAVAGVVPVTTIPSAVLLASALVAVVLVLAILPSLKAKTT